ncbi:MAG TPA: TIGR04551 family protein [Myxococcaceae bacterium]|nr:TIGR04551 family protein [Myxococcaceae bacterium]
MKAFFLAVSVLSGTALAQAPTTPPTSSPGTLPASGSVVAPAVPAGVTPSPQLDEAIQREIDAKVAQAKKELQEEMRAQAATQAATQPGWEDATVTSRTKLQLFVAHGYFRVRPELFNYFDMAQLPFNGYWLFPVPDGGNPIINPGGHTITGVNMRFRLEPTVNVSEELRIKAQIDMLDNLVWGSTPAYAYTRYQGTDVALLSVANQVPPSAGLNAALDSIAVKQVWGEVSTPVGLLKFGRMSTNFGMGINYNDGSCLDCDFESVMDAFQFVAEPLPGFYVIPMLEYDVTGLVNARTLDYAEQLDITQADNSTAYRIQIARLDTEQQAKAKIESGGTVINYGLDFSYRYQKYQYNSINATYNPPDAYQPGATLGNRTARFGNLSIPDIWLKVENRTFRVELEAVSYLGSFSAPILPGGVAANVTVVQFGVAGEAEYKILHGAVGLGFKGGFASGDSAPGFGVRVTRASLKPGATTPAAQPGDIDGAQFGRQYTCPTNPALTCTDADIRNYRFNPNYHIDQILFRYIIGTITDAWYIRPSAYWNISDGLQVSGNMVYSQSIYLSSTPSASRPGAGSNALGLEIDLGVRYQTEDGLFAWLYYGILFPFDGLQNTDVVLTQSLHVAQSIRGMIGIRF